MGIEKYKMIAGLAEHRLVGIIRCSSEEEAVRKSESIIEGGIKILEVSLTTPGALQVINRLVKTKQKDVFIGAGTVLDSESARACILAGSEFIIAPNLNREMVFACNRYAVPCIPGVGSTTEVVRALEWGCDIVKAFPGSVLGTSFIKAVKGPVPQAEIIPVGGVSLSNIEDWFAAGAFAVALGSALTHPSAGEDPETIRKNTGEVVELVNRLNSGRKLI